MLDRALVALRIDVCKSVGVEGDLAEVAVREVAAGKAFFAAHVRASRAGLRASDRYLKSLKDRELTQAHLNAAVAKFVVAYDHVFDPLARKIVDRLARPIYEASKAAVWRRITGDDPNALAYELPKVALAKKDDDPLKGVDVKFGARDERLERALEGFVAFWAAQHSALFAVPLQGVVDPAGLTAAQGAERFREATNQRLGLVDGASPAEAAYAQGTAAVLTTTTRAAAALAAADDLGVRTMTWVAVGDELVCDRCSEMDGREFVAGDVLGHVERTLAVRDRDELKATAPWLSASALRDLVAAADETDDPSGAILEAGVSIPAHAACRCLWDVSDTTPTLGPDTNDITADVRDEVAERQVAAVDLPAKARRPLVDAIAGFAAWRALTPNVEPGLPALRGVPDDVASRVGALDDGRTLFVDAAHLSQSYPTGYNAAAYALGRAAPRRLSIPAAAVIALFKAAKARGTSLSETSFTSPQHYFAEGVEAYVERDGTGRASDRALLKTTDPRLHDFLDDLLQRKVIGKVEATAQETVALVEESPVGKALAKIEMAMTEEGYFLALEGLASLLVALPVAIASLAAQAAVHTGVEKGWVA